MALLDDLSGFEFEDLVTELFRELGHENVRQSRRTADEGRDILFEEAVDGRRRGVVVECKHTDTVGRPVVQKLHSAVATYEFDGPKRGLVVTTGRFTEPARAYAERLAADSHPIELIDGADLADLAAEAGLAFRNGRVELVCEESLRPAAPGRPVDAALAEAARDVEALDTATLPDPHTRAVFHPLVLVGSAAGDEPTGQAGTADWPLVARADRDPAEPAGDEVRALVADHHGDTVALDEARDGRGLDDVRVERFVGTRSAYEAWAADRFGGPGGRTADRKQAAPGPDREHGSGEDTDPPAGPAGDGGMTVDPLYLPEIHHRIELGEYTYRYSYLAAGDTRIVTEDGLHRCVHCEDADRDGARTGARAGEGAEAAATGGEPASAAAVAGGRYTYCPNCGAVACSRHVRTERVEGTPVCTGCAVTGSFALTTKYFYDRENRERFRAAYREMPVYRKLMENALLAWGGLVVLLFLVVGLLAAAGVV
jgi:restriction endonuclease Mrr